MVENTSKKITAKADVSSGIDPEVAYVKSMDYLDKALAQTALTVKNLRSYQIGGAVLSVLLGIMLLRSFGNIFGLLAPIVGMNIAFYIYSRKVLKRIKNAEAKAVSDKDSLIQGELDPREFYGHLAEVLTASKKAAYLESLSGDTSKLTPEEKSMLSKYYN